MTSSQNIIKEMIILAEWRIHANCYYANNEVERIVFIRSSPTERLDYILKIMQDKGLAQNMIADSEQL